MSEFRSFFVKNSITWIVMGVFGCASKRAKGKRAHFDSSVWEKVNDSHMIFWLSIFLVAAVVDFFRG